MNNSHFNILVLILGFAIFTITACDSSIVFEQNRNIKNSSWAYDDVKQFELEITDTTQRYDLFLHLRHTGNYPYQNLWVKIKTTFPSGKNIEQGLDIPLADLEGKWYGSGMTDVKSREVIMQQNAIFPEVGKYLFEISQDMRENPINEVMDVGLGIKKSKIIAQ